MSGPNLLFTLFNSFDVLIKLNVRKQSVPSTELVSDELKESYLVFQFVKVNHYKLNNRPNRIFDLIITNKISQNSWFLEKNIMRKLHKNFSLQMRKYYLFLNKWVCQNKSLVLIQFLHILVKGISIFKVLIFIVMSRNDWQYHINLEAAK